MAFGFFGGFGIPSFGCRSLQCCQREFAELKTLGQAGHGNVCSGIMYPLLFAADAAHMLPVAVENIGT
jgi:hypothetical protein